MNASWRLGLLVSIVMSVLACGARGEEQWLGYRISSGNIWQEVGGVCAKNLKMTSDAPPGVAMPKFNDTVPLFGQWFTPMTKSGHFWFALDRSVKGGYYDRLYIDANGNAKLTDETSVAARQADKYRSEFGPVKVLLEGDDGPVTYHLDFRFYNYQGNRDMNIASACWYEGTVTVDDKKWQCILVDYNSNGTFNDTSSNLDDIDRIGIAPPAPSTSAKAANADNGMTMYFAGKYIDIDGKYYHPAPARDGACITFTPMTNVPMGSVRIAKEITRVTAGGENGLLPIRAVDGQGKLPVGKYRIYEWAIVRKDADGVSWKLRGSGFGNSGDFEAAEGKEAALGMGEPVAAALSVQKDNRGQCSISLSYQGKLGERLEVLRNNERAPEPRVTIKNADGTYARTLTLEYG
jgi:hypothetical protein